MSRVLLTILIFFRWGPVYATPATIDIKWVYKNIDGIKIELHEADYKAKVWKTGNVKTLEKSVVGNKIDGNSIKIETNERRKFALVVHNDTNKAKYFFAAPHAMNPEELSFGLKFKCLCVNHAFKVKPGGYWYRVVELKVGPEFEAKKMTISHTIIGMEPAKAEQFNKSNGYNADAE